LKELIRVEASGRFMQDEPLPNKARLDGHKCTFYPAKARKAYCLLSSGGMTNRSPFQPDFSPTSWYKAQWRPFLPLPAPLDKCTDATSQPHTQCQNTHLPVSPSPHRRKSHNTTSHGSTRPSPPARTHTPRNAGPRLSPRRAYGLA
jgi:hypothetical protein